MTVLCDSTHNIIESLSNYHFANLSYLLEKENEVI